MPGPEEACFSLHPLHASQSAAHPANQINREFIALFRFIFCVFLEAPRRHGDAFVGMRRAPVEIVLEQSGLGENSRAEPEAVAIEADGAQHFLVWTEVGVLVVLCYDTLSPRDHGPLSRQMTGRARDAVPGRGGAGQLFLPEQEVRGFFISQAVRIVVTAQTRVHRGTPGIELVRAMTRTAPKLPMACLVFHGLAGKLRRHGRKLLRHSHPVPPRGEAIDFAGMTIPAKLESGFYVPGYLAGLIGPCVTTAAIHAATRVGSALPALAEFSAHAQVPGRIGSG